MTQAQKMQKLKEFWNSEFIKERQEEQKYSAGWGSPVHKQAHAMMVWYAESIGVLDLFESDFRAY